MMASSAGPSSADAGYRLRMLSNGLSKYTEMVPINPLTIDEQFTHNIYIASLTFPNPIVIYIMM